MRRVLQVVAILCTLIVGAASLALIVSQTAWFKDWLRGFIVRQADDYLNGRLTIGRLITQTRDQHDIWVRVASGGLAVVRITAWRREVETW